MFRVFSFTAVIILMCYLRTLPVLFNGCWTRAFLGGLQAEYKKKDETLDGEKTASCIVAWSLYTETGSVIDLWP